MNVEDAIETALFASAIDIATFDAAHKAWPNASFDPPADAYMRVDHLPNGSQRLSIKSVNPHLYFGILQITVVAPLNVGVTAARQLAAEIADAYPADRTMTQWGTTVRVEKAPDVGRGFAGDAKWNVVVSIPYQSLALPGLILSLDFTKPRNSQYLPFLS